MDISNIYLLKDAYGSKITTGTSFMSAYQKAAANPKCSTIEKVNVDNSSMNKVSTVWKSSSFDCYI